MLCPNEGGAFKQTTNGEWAHLLCAMYIAETSVGNSIIQEPIEGIERIEKARWKLVRILHVSANERILMFCIDLYDMQFGSRKWSLYTMCEDSVLYSLSYDLCEEVKVAYAYEGCGGGETSVD